MGTFLEIWQTRLEKISRTFVCAAILGIAPNLVAVAPTDGFFYGIDMEPVDQADIVTVETEPAVALVFAVDQKTADITRQFDQWFAANPPSGVNVYAIAVESGGVSREVVLEAIAQRRLQMPVFLSRSDMLLGDDFRLLVLNNDSEVARFTTADFAGVDAAIRDITGTSPTPPAAPVITPADETPVPTESEVIPLDDESDVEYDVKTETGTLPDGSTYTRVTTTTRSRSSSSAQLQGGLERDNLYVNRQFGMVAEFPPGWQYRVANRQDGAVAVPPTGSQMDLRVWSLVAGSAQTPQQYIDETLESLASRLKTRVNVERRFEVDENGEPGVDITYNYSKPLDPDNPARGGLLFRGRMQVFVDQGYVKAVSVDAPSAEFRASTALIDNFFRSFQIRPEEIPATPNYSGTI